MRHHLRSTLDYSDLNGDTYSSSACIMRKLHRIVGSLVGIITIFQRLVTVLCTAQTAGKLPAVRAVQVNCETVLSQPSTCVGIIIATTYICTLYNDRFFNLR